MTQAAILAASGSPGTTTGFKNKLINGNMNIDQRYNGTSITPATTYQYTLDRWETTVTQSSKLTVQQNSGNAPASQGFASCMKITSSSAYSVSSSDRFSVEQYIEGYNVSDLGWGTASAKSVTLSFWVNCSLTGTFGGSVIAQSGSPQYYPFSYTISSANTWEYKTVTIPGNTTVSINTNSSTGVIVMFGLGMGSTFSGTAGTWSSSTYYSATGATSVVGTSGATFYITGTQFEVGTTATNFDFRSIGTETMLCQRYYMTKSMWVNGNAYTNNSRMSSGIDYPVEMRAAPTATITASTSTNCNTPIMFNGTTNRYSIYVNSVGSSTDMTFTATVTFSSEL
jgi:hypothetical protein